MNNESQTLSNFISEQIEINPNIEDIIVRQREYINAILPYTDIKTKIFSLATPTITIFPDGRVERDYNFSDTDINTLKNCNEAIELIKSKFIGY